MKICGITNADDARVAVQAGADFIGLILVPSPRQVRAAVARAIVDGLPAGAVAVGVVRDAPLDKVVGHVRHLGLGWIQLHGREPAAYLGMLVDRCPGLRVIKAWELSEAASDSDALHAYLRDARIRGRLPDVILLDVPKDGPHPGYEAMGAIARACSDRPPRIWCAGGLTPANVAAALACGDYDGIDVARGVESAPGRKDPVLVRQFVEAARRA